MNYFSIQNVYCCNKIYQTFSIVIRYDSIYENDFRIHKTVNITTSTDKTN